MKNLFFALILLISFGFKKSKELELIVKDSDQEVLLPKPYPELDVSTTNMIVMRKIV